MTHPMNNDDELRRLLARGMNDPMPPEARAKLERTYASLDSIPPDVGGIRDGCGFECVGK